MTDLEGVVCCCREVRLCGAKRRVQVLKRRRGVPGGLLNLHQHILGILEGLLHIAVVCVHDADQLINIADDTAKRVQRLRRIERHRTTVFHDLVQITGDAVDVVDQILSRIAVDESVGRIKYIFDGTRQAIHIIRKLRCILSDGCIFQILRIVLKIRKIIYMIEISIRLCLITTKCILRLRLQEILNRFFLRSLSLRRRGEVRSQRGAAIAPTRHIGQCRTNRLCDGRGFGDAHIIKAGHHTDNDPLLCCIHRRQILPQCSHNGRRQLRFRSLSLCLRKLGFHRCCARRNDLLNIFLCTGRVALRELRCLLYLLNDFFCLCSFRRTYTFRMILHMTECCIGGHLRCTRLELLPILRIRQILDISIHLSERLGHALYFIRHILNLQVVDACPAHGAAEALQLRVEALQLCAGVHEIRIEGIQVLIDIIDHPLRGLKIVVQRGQGAVQVAEILDGDIIAIEDDLRVAVDLILAGLQLLEDLVRDLQLCTDIGHIIEDVIEVVEHGVRIITEIILDVLDILDLVKRTDGARGHREDRADGLELISTETYLEVSLLARQRGEHDAGVLAEGHGLALRCIDRVALLDVDRDRHEEHHVVLHVLRHALVRRTVDVHLDEAGRTGDLIRIGYDTVQLIGDVEGPRCLDLIRLQLALEEELSVLVLLEGDGAVLDLRLLLIGHVGDLQVVTEVGVAARAVEVDALDDIGITDVAVVVEVQVQGLIDVCGRLSGIRRHRCDQDICGKAA